MKKRVKLKSGIVKLLKIIGIIFVMALIVLAIYRYNIDKLKKIGYSEKASNNILFKFKEQYVLSVGKNKTLNAAFTSKEYKDKYLDHYAKIKYQKEIHLIRNINLLLKKGYNDDEVSMILSHGNDTDVIAFIKRDKIKYLEEFFSYGYAKIKNYDRYVAYADKTGEDEETTVRYVNLDLDKDDYADPLIIKDYDPNVLVTKHRMLGEKYVPDNLVSISEEYATDKGMKASRIALNAFISMSKEATKEGYGIKINSAYRSYQDQQELCDTYVKIFGQAYVDKYVAKAGYSEHQTGFAFDIASTSSNVFATSREYTWMQENAYKYGFIQRYPKGYEEVTGFRSEAWHYRYVGEKIATYIHKNKITYDEYYIMFLDK